MYSEGASHPYLSQGRHSGWEGGGGSERYVCESQRTVMAMRSENMYTHYNGM